MPFTLGNTIAKRPAWTIAATRTTTEGHHPMQLEALERDSESVGTDGEEHGVAERQEPGDPEDQVVADGVERQDEDLDRKPLEEACVALVVGEHGPGALAVDHDRDHEREQDEQARSRSAHRADSGAMPMKPD